MAVTEAESEILTALWDQGPLSAQALVATVRTRKSWAEPTIKTLLHRLLKKDLVRSSRDDGRHLYHALIEREAYYQGEIQALADRLFHGRRDEIRKRL